MDLSSCIARTAATWPAGATLTSHSGFGNAAAADAPWVANSAASEVASATCWAGRAVGAGILHAQTRSCVEFGVALEAWPHEGMLSRMPMPLRERFAPPGLPSWRCSTTSRSLRLLCRIFSQGPCWRRPYARAKVSASAGVSPSNLVNTLSHCDTCSSHGGTASRAERARAWERGKE